jgi:hypothetical protein
LHNCQSRIIEFASRGFVCYYDPTLFGHHAEITIGDADAATCRKGRAYGRGLGHVLRIHDYTWLDAARWIGRSLARVVQSLVFARAASLRFYGHVAYGRFEGWFNLARD